jgi:hypothetical protein
VVEDTTSEEGDMTTRRTVKVQITVDPELLAEQAQELGNLITASGPAWAEGLWDMCHAILDQADRPFADRRMT